MMQRRTDCENVILSAKEKKLLKKIQRHPHRKCSNQEIHTLKMMGLVTPDTCGVDAFNAPIPTGTYCVSEFYLVYKEYRKDNRRDRMLTSLWLPIVVSVITTLTVNALQWSWPLLVQWFANCH